MGAAMLAVGFLFFAFVFALAAFDSRLRVRSEKPTQRPGFDVLPPPPKP
jgi:hypothetical protein